MSADNDDKAGGGTGYDVGYGKPPKHSRWTKGQPSPNPKGRPKNTRNLKSDLLDELGEQLVLREGNRPLRISKQRAMVKALAAKAIKGDTRAINVLVGLLLRFDPPEASVDDVPDLSTEDIAILDAFLRRNVARKARGPSHE